MDHKRLGWVDGLRGLAVFLVVLGHLYKGFPLIFPFCTLIAMPMFYFLAGYVFHEGKPLGAFLKGLFFRLYVPYLIFSLLPLKSMLLLLNGDLSGLVEYWKDFFSGRIFWFVPSFLVTQMLFYLLSRLEANRLVLLAAGGVCFALGVAAADVPWMDIWCVNTALTGTLYMFMRAVLKKSSRGIPLREIAAAGVIYLGALLLCILRYPGGAMDFHLVDYDNPFLFLVLTVSELWICVGIAQRLHWPMAAAPWQVLGRETLVVYLTHSWVQYGLSIVFTSVMPINGQLFFRSIVYCILTCTVSMCISLGIGYVCPELVGKKRR